MLVATNFMLIFQAPFNIPAAWYSNARKTALMPPATGRMGLIAFRGRDFSRVLEWSKRLKVNPEAKCTIYSRFSYWLPHELRQLLDFSTQVRGFGWQGCCPQEGGLGFVYGGILFQRVCEIGRGR